MKISVCIITLNEERHLPRCLRSVVSLADEIIILDSGSVDHTKEVALAFGAQFFHQPWLGYVGQKNAAIALAQHEWIFSIDADEEVSEPLKKSILAFKNSNQKPKENGFAISRVVFFMGKWIRFGDWYPDYIVRLFRRHTGKFAGGAVHERLEVTGSIGYLKGELHHFTYKNREDQQRRIEKYSTLWAQSAFEQKKTSWSWTPYLRAGWRLFRGFVLKGGWRGGKLGWQISHATAYEVFLKYRKLAALWQQQAERPHVE